jgi:hypothetical protein
MRTAVVIVIVGLAGLWLCGEAAALFVGPAEPNPNSVEAGEGDAAVNPFSESENVGPGVMPESVRDRPSSWYSRPHNARHFDALLRNQAEPGAAAQAEQAPGETPSTARREGGSHLFDYLFALVVLAGVGTAAFLLFRNRGVP